MQGALVLHGSEHEQLTGNKLVLALLRQFVGQVEQLAEGTGNVQITARPLDPRQLVELFRQLGTQQVDVDTGAREQRAHRAALLVEQGKHQVYRLDELVVATDRK